MLGIVNYATRQTRTQTTHKMKWVPIGTFCSTCLNIDYYPSWLKANKKKYEWIRHENKKI